MFKKYILTFLNSLLFLYVATFSSAGLSYLVRLAIIMVFPSSIVRNICYTLFMGGIIFFLVFLCGSNMGYRHYDCDKKFSASLATLPFIPSLVIYAAVSFYFSFHLFTCGPVNTFVAAIMNVSEVEKIDFVAYPPATVYAIIGFIIFSSLYLFAFFLGMKAGYKDKLEDGEIHKKILRAFLKKKAEETPKEPEEAPLEENNGSTES